LRKLAARTSISIPFVMVMISAGKSRAIAVLIVFRRRVRRP
jgi:hypothetical protein